MAEVLPDMAGFHRPLQRERLARASAEGLLGGVLRFCHALLVETPKVMRVEPAQDAPKPDR